ncbi:hypothetical protein HA402_014752 [Bradysia odoriphaga]|nr:hypothetical protein HA402_014752 [Bradysia odoriphaga]
MEVSQILLEKSGYAKAERNFHILNAQRGDNQPEISVNEPNRKRGRRSGRNRKESRINGNEDGRNAQKDGTLKPNDGSNGAKQDAHGKAGPSSNVSVPNSEHQAVDIQKTKRKRIRNRNGKAKKKVQGDSGENNDKIVGTTRPKKNPPVQLDALVSQLTDSVRQQLSLEASDNGKKKTTMKQNQIEPSKPGRSTVKSSAKARAPTVSKSVTKSTGSDRKRRNRQKTSASRCSSPDVKLTPYQGSKRTFGEFKCVKCKHQWESGYSWANMGQQCKRCKIYVYPYRQTKLQEDGINRGQKEHEEKLCQQCQSIGFNCRYL